MEAAFEESPQTGPVSLLQKNRAMYIAKSYQFFSSLSNEEKAGPTSFLLRYSPQESDEVEWVILPKSTPITDNIMPNQSDSHFNVDIPWNSDPLNVEDNKIRIEHILPFLK